MMAINWSAVDNYMQAVAVGLTLFGLIMVFGQISGCHLNPAITIAVLIKEGRGKGKEDKLLTNIISFLVIMISQFVGGIIGLCFVYFTL